jgi:hypothetical protein
MQTPMHVHVHVDFPALSELVVFLRESNQQPVDALTAKIKTATLALSRSEAALQNAMITNQGE